MLTRRFMKSNPGWLFALLIAGGCSGADDDHRSPPVPLDCPEMDLLPGEIASLGTLGSNGRGENVVAMGACGDVAFKGTDELVHVLRPDLAPRLEVAGDSARFSASGRWLSVNDGFESVVHVDLHEPDAQPTVVEGARTTWFIERGGEPMSVLTCSATGSGYELRLDGEMLAEPYACGGLLGPAGGRIVFSTNGPSARAALDLETGEVHRFTAAGAANAYPDNEVGLSADGTLYFARRTSLVPSGDSQREVPVDFTILDTGTGEVVATFEGAGATELLHSPLGWSALRFGTGDEDTETLLIGPSHEQQMLAGEPLLMLQRSAKLVLSTTRGVVLIDLPTMDEHHVAGTSFSFNTKVVVSDDESLFALSLSDSVVVADASGGVRQEIPERTNAVWVGAEGTLMERGESPTGVKFVAPSGETLLEVPGATLGEAEGVYDELDGFAAGEHGIALSIRYHEGQDVEDEEGFTRRFYPRSLVLLNWETGAQRTLAEVRDPGAGIANEGSYIVRSDRSGRRLFYAVTGARDPMTNAATRELLGGAFPE